MGSLLHWAKQAAAASVAEGAGKEDEVARLLHGQVADRRPTDGPPAGGGTLGELVLLLAGLADDVPGGALVDAIGGGVLPADRAFEGVCHRRVVEVVVGVGLIHEEDEDVEDAENAEEDSKEYQGFNLMSREREREREHRQTVVLWSF